MSHIIGEPHPRDSSNQVYNTRCALFLIAVAEKRNPISTFRIALIYSLKKGELWGCIVFTLPEGLSSAKKFLSPKRIPCWSLTSFLGKWESIITKKESRHAHFSILLKNIDLWLHIFVSDDFYCAPKLMRSKSCYHQVVWPHLCLVTDVEDSYRPTINLIESTHQETKVL